MLDARLGYADGKTKTDTRVCAYSGAPVSSGMVRFSLGGHYYFRVFAMHQRYIDDAFIADMKALIPKAKTKTMKTIEANEDE